MRAVARSEPKRPALRIGLLAWCLAGSLAIAGIRTPTIDEIAALPDRARENLLAAIRNSHDGEITLLMLETAASVRADERRDSGVPPLSRGCLRPDEFELGVQLALARAAYDGSAYRALSWEFHRLSTALDKALAGARASGNWRKRFAHLERWIRDWEDAKDPASRELFRRTLVDQAIRASLSSFEGAKIYGKTRPTPALRAYDEYLFNLMCTADEENLRWLKTQVSAAGWFDAGRHGKAADQAAWLMVQHADGDPTTRLRSRTCCSPSSRHATPIRRTLHPSSIAWPSTPGARRFMPRKWNASVASHWRHGSPSPRDSMRVVPPWGSSLIPPSSSSANSCAARRRRAPRVSDRGAWRTPCGPARPTTRPTPRRSGAGSRTT